AVALLALFSPFGSLWSADTCALATSALKDDGVCTITSTVAPPPFLIVPRSQITKLPSWPHSPWLGSISTIGALSGTDSDSCTPVASSGPALVIGGWKFNSWPGLTPAGLALSVTPTSALPSPAVEPDATPEPAS